MSHPPGGAEPGNPDAARAEASHAVQDGARRTAPSASRNRDALLAVLHDRLTAPARLLEIASGTGEHALWFSQALPHVLWQPTDRDPDALTSIAAWREDAGPNLLPPLLLDAASPDWPHLQADAILAVNMIHIAPWVATIGLMAGAARTLAPGGRLFLYGPFREHAATTPGNATFHAELQARDPAWGVRELDEVIAAAAAHALVLHERVAMPASNLVLVFQRPPHAA